MRLNLLNTPLVVASTLSIEDHHRVRFRFGQEYPRRCWSNATFVILITRSRIRSKFLSLTSMENRPDSVGGGCPINALMDKNIIKSLRLASMSILVPMDSRPARESFLPKANSKPRPFTHTVIQRWA